VQVEVGKDQVTERGDGEMIKEKIPLAIIYKQNGLINIDFSQDSNKGYELFGFLKCLIKKMEEELTNSIEDKK